MTSLEKFKEAGWVHLKGALPITEVEKAQRITIQLKQRLIDLGLIGTEKEFGTKMYWSGLDMAGMESRELYDMYTSSAMYEIASLFLEAQPYLFNDQIVVKLPNENFEFSPRYDNQYGPDPEAALKGDFKTITCAWILDDFKMCNGPIHLQHKQSGVWSTPLPRVGDMLIWDGNTVHKSGINKDINPRRIWLNVYSTINMSTLAPGFNNLYTDKFNGNLR
jgi:hypothetical protein